MTSTGHFHKNKQYFANHKWTIKKVHKEIDQGLGLLNKIDRPIISFFGSHRVKTVNAYYKHSKQLAYALGVKGYAILSGGGPGIMHAANAGATTAKTISIGVRA